MVICPDKIAILTAHQQNDTLRGHVMLSRMLQTLITCQRQVYSILVAVQSCTNAESDADCGSTTCMHIVNVGKTGFDVEKKFDLFAVAKVRCLCAVDKNSVIVCFWIPTNIQCRVILRFSQPWRNVHVCNIEDRCFGSKPTERKKCCAGFRFMRAS